MNTAIHTSDIRTFDKLWLLHGGTIEAVRRTGENRYNNPAFKDSVRANGRRKDVPAILLSRLNTLLRLEFDKAAIVFNHGNSCH